MEATDVYGLVGGDRIDRVQRDLARRGLTPPRVQVHPATQGTYQLHDETLHHDAASARRGAALGLVLGGLLGVLAALLLPQVTHAGSIAGVTASLSGLGGLVGGMAGLQRADPVQEGDPVEFREIGGDDLVVVVEVHDEHWHNRAHRVLERHGAVFLQDPTPVR